MKTVIMKNLIANASRKTILMMSLLASMVVLISCGDDDDDTPDPDPDPATVNAGFTSEVDVDDSFTYHFTNTSVILGIDDLTATYAWDFGGDGTSTEANPSHTFSAAGDYDVVLTVTAADGTEGTASETITVTAPKNKWASITDTSADDTGELRYHLGSDSIRTGRVTFAYRVTSGAKDGFVHLAGRSGTGDFAIMEVRFKDEGSHEFREGASDDAIASANFPDPKVDVWVPVEVSWSADGSSTPTFSLSIDGQVVISDAVSTTNGGDGDVPDHLEATKDGLFYVAWKYNSNSSTDEGVFEVDDFKLYSSDSGSEVEVYMDDFQGYAEGTDLDPDNNEASVYHTNTSEATVAEEE